MTRVLGALGRGGGLGAMGDEATLTCLRSRFFSFQNYVVMSRRR